MNPQEFVSTLNECLAEGFTVSELAEEFKVSESTIGRWQNGQVPNEPVRSTVCERMKAVIDPPPPW